MKQYTHSVCPTGDQAVAGLIPTGSGNILSWKLIIQYYCTVIFSLPLIQEGQLSVSGKECAQVLVNSLED